MRLKSCAKSILVPSLVVMIAVTATALVINVGLPEPAKADEEFDRDECLNDCRLDYPPNDDTSRRIYARCVQKCERTYWCIEKCEENHKPGTDAYKKCSKNCIENNR